MAKATTFFSNISQRFLKLCEWTQRSESSSSSTSAPPLASSPRWDPEALKRTLQRIEAVLHDAEEREISDESVRLWLRELRVVAYDADEVLDVHEHELLRDKAQSRDSDEELPDPTGERQIAEQVGGSTIIPSSSDLDVVFRGKIASRVGEIIKRFDEIARDREALHLREDDGKRVREGSRRRLDTSSLLDSTEIFKGREADVERINSLLLPDECSSKDLSVISVVGMGGVGKTTLVRHVYNDRAVCERFELKGWVCVSDDYADVVQLTRKILEAFTSITCDLRELDPIQRRLVDTLKDKRFLLVLDDVWNEDRALWEALRTPLTYGGKGGVVLTTTRSEKVATMMQTVPFHKLECLSLDDCWAVFKVFAFRVLDPGEYEEFEVVGRKISDKCKGLPLAAKALGSMLSYKSEPESWEEVYESEIWDLPEQDKEILPALRLSYIHLPPHLKRCFVYCCLFPKDFRFEKDDLVLLWMAQGFIHNRRRTEVEDVGAEYVDELMQRSFFQYYDTKNPTIFVMHDLIHDLAQFISKGEFWRAGREVALEDHSYTRHLSVASMYHDIPAVLRSMPNLVPGGLRTLHLFSVSEVLQFPSTLLPKLKGLRTLVLSGQHILELPDSIGDLKHLRYLDLSGTCISKLPDTVSNMYYLQTLLLRRCTHVESLPEVLLKLTNLRCLEFSRYL